MDRSIHKKLIILVNCLYKFKLGQLFNSDSLKHMFFHIFQGLALPPLLLRDPPGPDGGLHGGGQAEARL